MEARSVSTASHPVICAHCGTPVAEYQNGVLVIKSTHHGKQHVTVVPQPAKAPARTP